MAESDNLVAANPSLNRGENCTMTAAFDIGTTYSGYAYSLKLKPEEVILNPHWGSEVGAESYKTPTAVLTDSNKEFVAFGYQAKQMYTQENEFHLYDQCFKMELYKAQTALKEIEVASRDDTQTIALLTLFTMTLRYLFHHLVEGLENSHEGLDQSLIRVVLTVPAIWSDSAKDFMNSAAYEAGIDPNNVILALEPEAASLYCRTLRPRELRADKAIDLQLPTGTRYIVLDCGGGTIDITLHEVIDESSVKEIHCANGGPWGGGQVNTRYELLLKELLGEEVVDDCKKKHCMDWFEIVEKFELFKRRPLSNAVINLHHTITGDMTPDGFKWRPVNSPENGEYDLKDGKLRLTEQAINSLFDETETHIMDHVRNLWKINKIKHVKYAFMVGGFSNCDRLYNKVIETFNDLDKSVLVLRPAMAHVAVVKGAVQFGYKTATIKSRISRLTYGAGVMKPFDPLVHLHKYKRIVDGDVKCSNIFDVWARKNESIDVGEQRVFTIYPHSKSSTEFRIHIYAINSETVMYTTDPGVKEIASLQISVPDNHLPKYERDVKHYVYFGGTELHVRIKDEARNNGESKGVTIDFDQ